MGRYSGLSDYQLLKMANVPPSEYSNEYLLHLATAPQGTRFDRTQWSKPIPTNTFADRDPSAAQAREQLTPAANIVNAMNLPQQAVTGGVDFYDATVNNDVAAQNRVLERVRTAVTDPMMGTTTFAKVDDLVAAMQQKYPQLQLAIGEGKNGLELYKIQLPKELQGQGIGSDVLKELTQYADDTGQRIVATPSTDFGGTKSRIVEFNKRFGFVENKGKNKDFTTRETMYRDPLQ